MASITLTKMSARAVLNNGQDAQGNKKYTNLSLGNMSEDYWASNESSAASKLISVIGALEPCLNKTLERVELVATSGVTA